MDKVREFVTTFASSRTNLILAGVLLLILVGFGVLVNKFVFTKSGYTGPLEEVDLQFDPENPYALLLPRKDGNAINLNIKRVSQYDAFSYEVVYSADGIDRGAGSLGTFVDLDDSKGEYKQEILFGTCSKGDTSDPLHCVFDKNVENGTLTLGFRKENKLYKMLTTWHLQKPDVALGEITSGDGHFVYKTDAKKEDLVLAAYTIVNDLSGAPKLPDGKQFMGKVYALNVPTAKTFPNGKVLIEIDQAPPADAKLGRFNESKNMWDLYDTKIEGNKLSANGEGAGIYAVLIGKKAE